MTAAPFKKGDIVMLAKEWRVKGEVFFVRQEQADKEFHGYSRTYKVARKGDWTIGVNWEDVSERSYHQIRILNKWQNAKNLVLFENHPDKEMYRHHFGRAS
jgi:ribosomal protein L16 Arg81 hydroxylase